MPRQLFTAGYQGSTIDTFIANLAANNIECVLDVRALAFSRKPGFSKSQLQRRLDIARIRYVHLADLGTPKRIRENLKSTGDYGAFFERMERYLTSKKDAIEAAYSHVVSHTCCLMCFERLATECHRKIVAHRIKARDGNGLQIRHI
ncbi:MAG TPA: DUF488 domain-containing protein [Sedimentisphaerales bacterium]|nr:DUF488 domain-containing protein [Sedimentisphaerales bacterium]